MKFQMVDLKNFLSKTALPFSGKNQKEKFKKKRKEKKYFVSGFRSSSVSGETRKRHVSDFKYF